MNRYEKLIEQVFYNSYKKGDDSVAFSKDEFEECARTLRIDLPKNVPDVIYSFRHRNPLPDSVRATALDGREWVIEGTAKGEYKFKLVKVSRIRPNENLATIKVPDATPTIVAANAFSDEQALLARVRYNRLIDAFLGVVAYSLQNHLRTTVSGIGQIEIDEIYVAIDKNGRQFVLPVQAKGGKDQLGIVQTSQDISCCQEKYPSLICRAVSAQFMDDEKIAMFELTIEDDEVKVLQEKHYKLVPADQVTSEDLKRYENSGED